MKTTKIMGIVNVTPDSFFAESRTYDPESALKRAYTLVEEGADILDIGGESSRPKSVRVPLEEELKRVGSFMKVLSQDTKLKTPLSIDTTKPEVAERALEYGATIINDITGFTNPEMRKLAKESGAFCVVMHMQKTPETMQENPFYEKGVVQEVFDFLKTQTDLLLEEGIRKERIIIDPGIGFGKTMSDNFALLRSVPIFHKLGFELLYGISRKGFMRKFLGDKADLLLSTLTIDTFLMLQRVDIIRVHDVKEHHEARMLLQQCG